MFYDAITFTQKLRKLRYRTLRWWKCPVMAVPCIHMVSVEWYSPCLKNLRIYAQRLPLPSHHQPSPPEVKTLITWGRHPGRKSLLSQIMRKTSQSQCRPELLTQSHLRTAVCSSSLLWLPLLLVLSLGITKTWLRLAAEQKVKMVALWN